MHWESGYTFPNKMKNVPIALCSIQWGQASLLVEAKVPGVLQETRAKTSSSCSPGSNAYRPCIRVSMDRIVLKRDLRWGWRFDLCHFWLRYLEEQTSLDIRGVTWLKKSFWSCCKIAMQHICLGKNNSSKERSIKIWIFKNLLPDESRLHF